jgi:uroporphyrinogen-III decarboxylase
VTKKGRFLAAVRGETPDVVPVAPLIHQRYAHRILGRSGWRAVFEVHRLIGSVHHRGPLGVGLKVSLPEGYGSERREVERGPDGRTVTRWILRTPGRTLEGRIHRGLIPGDPLVEKAVEYPVKGVEDWKAYLDLRQRTLEGIQVPNLDGIRAAAAEMGEEGMPSVGLSPAYTALAHVRGMAEFMLDLEDHPDLMAELFEVERRIMEREVDAFLAAPTEVAWLDICWATGSGLGPERFRRWALPDVVRAVERIRGAPGKHLGLYTLGRIRKLLPMLVDAGVRFVETFEPNEGDITLGEAKRLYGERVCLMGNFDCVILARGSVEDARRETLRCLREGMAGGGYVLATADEVPADARLENLQAMVDTVERHGRY